MFLPWQSSSYLQRFNFSCPLMRSPGEIAYGCPCLLHIPVFQQPCTIWCYQIFGEVNEKLTHTNSIPSPLQFFCEEYFTLKQSLEHLITLINAEHPSLHSFPPPPHFAPIGRANLCFLLAAERYMVEHSELFL